MQTWDGQQYVESDDEYLTEQAVDSDPTLGRGVLPHMRGELKLRRTKKRGATTDHIREVMEAK